jgi:hypothetical protein
MPVVSGRGGNPIVIVVELVQGGARFVNENSAILITFERQTKLFDIVENDIAVPRFGQKTIEYKHHFRLARNFG